MARTKHTYYYRVYLLEKVWEDLIAESHLLGIDIEQFKERIKEWAYVHFFNGSESYYRATAMACTLINPNTLLQLAEECETAPPGWSTRPQSNPRWVLIDLPPDVMDATGKKARKFGIKADEFRCRLIRNYLERCMGIERLDDVKITRIEEE